MSFFDPISWYERWQVNKLKSDMNIDSGLEKKLNQHDAHNQLLILQKAKAKSSKKRKSNPLTQAIKRHKPESTFLRKIATLAVLTGTIMLGYNLVPQTILTQLKLS